MLPKEKIEKVLRDNPELDPLGMEGFLIIEDFEALFSGLVGVYSRLAFKEKFRKESPDEELYQKYHLRSQELHILKRNYSKLSLIEMRKCSDLYRAELHAMEKVERALGNG